MSAYEICLWLLIVILLGVVIWQRYGRQIKRFWEERKHQKKKRSFNLKPKEPKDCPCCVEEVGLQQVNPEPVAPVIPWSQLKKPGGPKKQVNTQNIACPNPKCKYVNNRNSDEHALVGCGVRGITDDIQWLKCQACQTRFSVRVDTPLKELKTPPERIGLVLSLLAEGVDPSTIIRLFGHCDETLQRWLTRAGQHAGLLHDFYFHDLSLEYLQMDELHGNIRQIEGKSWLWSVIDPVTKIIPSIHISSPKPSMP